jgi:hypothetical protein
MAVLCVERRFLLIALLNTDPMVGITQIKLGVEVGVAQAIHCLANER